MIRVTIRPFVPAFAAAALLLAGCEDNDTPSTPGQPPATTTSSIAQPSNEVASLVGCELIADDEIQGLDAKYKLTEPHSDGGEPASCDWHISAGAGTSIALGLTVRPDQRLDQVVVQDGWTSQDGKVQEVRDAKLLKQERDAGESCVFAMAVANTATVLVNAAGDKDVACEVVEKLAGIVHKKLEERGL